MPATLVPVCRAPSAVKEPSVSVPVEIVIELRVADALLAAVQKTIVSWSVTVMAEVVQVVDAAVQATAWTILATGATVAEPTAGTTIWAGAASVSANQMAIRRLTLRPAS